MEVVDHWKPGRQVLFWARASIFAPIAMMAIGAVLLPVSPRITSGAVFVAVLTVFFCLFRFWRELGHAEEIPEKARRQLRRNIPLFGPVVVVQLLIYSRFPNSGFSGLRDLGN